MSWRPITNVADLEACIEGGGFDFKREYDLAVPATRYEMAKDVAAFATAGGGTILVGVEHRQGRIVAFKSVAEPEKIVNELSTALQQHCVPIPSTPRECVIEVDPAAAAKLLAGQTAPSAVVSLLAINVQPDPRAPIGVRPELKGQPHADTYRFPVRIGDQTDFLDPTQLPMWMNSNERRVALRLNDILREKTPNVVRVHCRRSGVKTLDYARDFELRAVDEQASCVVVAWQPAPGRVVNVPLSFVVAVWKDADNRWEMAVTGSFSVDSSQDGFVPYFGGG